MDDWTRPSMPWVPWLRAWSDSWKAERTRDDTSELGAVATMTRTRRDLV